MSNQGNMLFRRNCLFSCFFPSFLRSILFGLNINMGRCLNRNCFGRCRCYFSRYCKYFGCIFRLGSLFGFGLGSLVLFYGLL